MHEVSPTELKQLLDSNADIQIIDIREDYEYSDFNLGGKNVPLDSVLSNFDKSDAKRTVFICNSGKRSSAIVRTLRVKHQLNNIFSLKGGLEKYLEEN